MAESWLDYVSKPATKSSPKAASTNWLDYTSAGDKPAEPAPAPRSSAQVADDVRSAYGSPDAGKFDISPVTAMRQPAAIPTLDRWADRTQGSIRATGTNARPIPAARAGEELPDNGLIGNTYTRGKQALMGLGAGLARTADPALRGESTLADAIVPGFGLVMRSGIGTAAADALAGRADAVEAYSRLPIEGDVTGQEVLDPSMSLDYLGKVGRFAWQAAPGSAAYMAGMATGPIGLGTVTTSMTGQIAQQRAEADGRARADSGDIAAAAPFAAASVALDRFGLDTIINPGVGNIVTRIGKAAGTEFGTEALQSGLEYTGGTLGTEQGFDAKEAGQQALLGGIAGGVMGGAMRGGIEAIDAGGRLAARNPADTRAPAPGITEQAVAAAAQPTPEDIASPLDTADIVGGKVEIAKGEADNLANEALTQANLPKVGSRVQITLPGGAVQQGTMTDYFSGEDGDGVHITLDDGKSFREYIDTINDTGTQITAQDPQAATTAAAMAEAQAVVDQVMPPAAESWDQFVEAPAPLEAAPAAGPTQGAGAATAPKASSAGLDAGIVAGLRQRGFSEQHAMGIAAGIHAESRSDPNVRGGYKGRALGIGQWLGERRAEIIRRYGEAPTLDQQLDFLTEELRGRDAGGAKVLSQTDAAAVLKSYIEDFMRPAKGAETSGDMRRGLAALGLGVDTAPVTVASAENATATDAEPATTEYGEASASTPGAEVAMPVKRTGDDVDPAERWRRPDGTDTALDFDTTEREQRVAIMRAAGVNSTMLPGGAAANSATPFDDLPEPVRARIHTYLGGALGNVGGAPTVPVAPTSEAPAPVAAPAVDATPIVRIEQTASGKGIAVFDATPAQIAAIKDALPNISGTPRSDGAVTYSKKYEDQIRTVLNKGQAGTGETKDGDWQAFPANSGTLGIPRAEMPQIKAEHRGAMVNFLNARGIQHSEVTVPASSLKPTQLEYSPEKALQAENYEGGDRAILISRDNHVVDGHHQWLAAGANGADVRAIKLDAPIRDVLAAAHAFPSSTTADGATEAKPEPAQEVAPPANAAEARDRTKPIGKNNKGHDVYEDENGVRSFVESGIRITEPVELRPTREGIRTSVNPDTRETRFLTDAERQAKMGAKPNGTAPEHEYTGVDDRELSEIVAEFNDLQRSQGVGDEQVTHIFDAPAKGEIVRLADKVKVYREGKGWMTPAEAAAQIAEWKAHAEAQGGPGSKNSDKVVLSLFDLSGEWSKPWEEAGYQVYRFDIQDDPEVGDVHNFSTEFFADWFGDFDGMDIHAILAANPCTDFASSGARHFAAKDADGRTIASVKLVHQTLATIEYFKPAVWAIENPVGRIESLGGLPPWRLSFDPNHIGETYTKKTLIWGRFNGDLPIAPVDPVEGSKMHKLYGGKSQATKNARSVTPEGFAYSFFMANNALDNPAMTIANKFDRLDRKLIARAVDAGVTPDQINSAVEDFYYQELDDDSANAAIRDLIGEKTSPTPAATTAATPAASQPADRMRATGRKKRVNGNPTLIEWISERGGIWDGHGAGADGKFKGGDLKAIGLADWHNKAPFRRKAIRDPKLGHGDRGLDNTLTDAIEAGFFPEWEATNGGYYGDLDPQILVDALSAELAGRPRYSKYGAAPKPKATEARTPEEGELDTYAELIGEVAQRQFGVDPEDLKAPLLMRAAQIKFDSEEGMTDADAFMRAVNELMAADRELAFARSKKKDYEFNDYDWPHNSENPAEGFSDGSNLAGQAAADAPTGVGGQAGQDSAGDRGEAGGVAPDLEDAILALDFDQYTTFLNALNPPRNPNKNAITSRAAQISRFHGTMGDAAMRAALAKAKPAKPAKPASDGQGDRAVIRARLASALKGMESEQVERVARAMGIDNPARGSETWGAYTSRVVRDSYSLDVLEQEITKARAPAPAPAKPANMDGFIKIAADNITKLREVDVERVLREAPSDQRPALLRYITDNRPDLAEEARAAFGDITGAVPAKPASDNAKFANNKLVTIDKLEAARARMRDRMNRLNSGVDPEMLVDGMIIAVAHIEAGVRNFAEFAKAMRDDFGNKITPFLQSFWEGARAYPGLDNTGMTTPDVTSAMLQMMLAETPPATSTPQTGIVPAEPARPSSEPEIAEPFNSMLIRANEMLPAGYAIKARPTASMANQGGAEVQFDGPDGFIMKTMFTVGAGPEALASQLGDWVSQANPKINPMRASMDLLKAKPAARISPPAENAPRQIEQTGDTALQALADYFVNGGSFQSIVAARMFLSENTFGMGTIKAGTAEAKAADEKIEAAIVLAARKIAAKGLSPLDTYRALVDLYGRQPNLAVRSSTSVEQQAYSTPVPLAYLASRRAGIGQETRVYEPSAGNGALLIDARATYVTANELNPDRAAMLRQLYRGATITQGDAMADNLAKGQFDAIIANPPFGAVRDDDGDTITFAMGNGYETGEIDHAIALTALDKMKDGGSAALIVGGINKLARDTKARSDAYNGKAKREFYYRLYSEYNVTDHFTVAGELYAKQGAGWPVDVIVIEGRGKSKLPLPAVSPPRQFASWGELESALDRRTGIQSEAGAADGRVDSGIGRPSRVDGRDSDGGRAGRPDRVGQLSEQGQSGEVRNGVVDGQPGSTGLDERQAGVPAGLYAGAAENNGNRATGRPAQVTAAAIEGENARQVTYNPASSSKSLDTLVPVNMQTAITAALNKLQDAVGKVDDFVADRLGYDPTEIANYFSAEQVDALALALDNMDKGAGFIIGDQTGIGKGRVVAGVIRYAIKSGRMPIFVTEKPNLYADMYRDMADIGLPEMLGRPVKILMTNAGETVPLDEDGKQILKTPGPGAHNARLQRVAGGERDDVDVVFTNYSQMQTVKGETTPRQAALSALAPGSIVIFDESHNAGGQGNKGDERKTKKQKAAEEAGTAPMNRAQFARSMAAAAHGVFFSSATYAKRPDVMDLYASTDMKLAVANIDNLATAITKGGIPMQQVVASMLTEAGQYVRRERSFDGVDYNTPTIEVDRTAYAQFAEVLRAIQQFQEQHIAEAIEAISEDVKNDAAAISHDGSIGNAGATSTNFTSVMHNLVEQMLVALKAEPAVARAIEAIKRGEKPVITLANTMGSFIQQYADDNDLSNGGEMPSDFRAMLSRYLDRTRHYTIKQPFSKEKGIKKYISDNELSSDALAAYAAVEAQIARMKLQDVPISPIDHIRNRLADAGYTVGEITGRTHTIDYSGGMARLRIRPGGEKSIAGKLKAMSGFNNGTIDVMILNQSGSTGLSLHASEKFKDQRPRRMIIAQAERNIDTHMQMLGRIHRTGQVVLPAYDQLVANVPAEMRPAAVLAKKMASLNANTTGSRGSAMTGEDVPDFINIYGDEIAARMMEEDPILHKALLKPLPTSKGSDEGLAREDAARKVTGKLSLMPLGEQEAFYETFLSEYRTYLAEKEAAGEAALEAKTLDLDAKPVESAQVIAPTQADSPFGAAVNREVLNVKRLGKPMTPAQVLAEVAKTIGEPAPESADIAALLAIEPKGKAWVREVYRTRMTEFDAYRREVLDGLDAEKIAAHTDRLNSNQHAFDQLTGILYPGSRVSFTTPAGFEFSGIVTSLEKKGSTKNPIALGSWRTQIALTDPARNMTIPLSQLRTNRMPESPVQSDIGTATHDGMTPILQAFEEMQNESREDRTIFTGNMLAAFEHTGGKGQIVNFVSNDGSVRPGIMMRRGYNYDKEIARQPVPLRTPEQVIAWVERGEIAFADGVKVERDGSQLVVTAAASKASGGRYFLNAAVRQALGGDFYKKSTGMVATTSLRDAAPVIAALQRAGAILTAKSNLDVARDIVGSTAGTTKESRAEYRGETTGARPQADVEALTASLEKQLKAMGLDGKVALRISKAMFRGSTAQGTYTPGRRMIEIALDARNDHSFVLNHEVIHALRDMGLFNKTDWMILAKAARSDARLWASINRRYADLTFDQREEEAVADMFAAYQSGDLKAQGTVERLLMRLIRFLSAVRNALRGQGFETTRTWREVFDDVATGRMAAGDVTAARGGAAQSSVPENSRITRAEFQRTYLQHIDVRGRDGSAVDTLAAVNSDGFKAGMGVNLLPVWTGGEARNIMEQRFLPKAGDVVYLVPPEGRTEGGNGAKIKDGWKPAQGEAVTVDYDGQDLYELFARDTSPDVRFSIPERENMVDLAGTDPTWKGQMAERFARWRTRMQDRYLPLLRVQSEIERTIGKTLPARMNPYLGEELMTGRIGARLDVLADDHVEPLLNAMHAEKVTTDELETYLYARHAPERNARIAEINPEMEGNGSGMTDLEAMAVMRRIERAGQMDAMERLAVRVDAIRDMALAQRVESGLLSQAEADEWRATYEYYVPLRGFKESPGNVANSQFAERINRSGGGINVRGRESKRAFGRRSQADSPIAYIILQAEEAIVRGETNRVAQRFINLARAAPDDDFWKVNKVTARQRINEETGLVEGYLANNLLAEDKDWTVSAKFNGKEVRVTMNRQNPAAARLADAMKNLTQHQLDWITEHLGKVNRFLSSVNTSYNPEFVITNAFRDLQTAAINLAGVDVKGLEAQVLKSYPAAIKASMQGAFGKESGEWGEAYREFTMAGGRVYFNRVEDVGEIKKRIERLAAQAGAKSNGDSLLRAKMLFGQVGKLVENVNLGIENAVRLATFKAARDAGLSPDRAASLAKNVTVNFNRRGTFGPFMNTAFLFYNASMQGTVRIAQAARSPRVRKMLAGVIVTGFLVEMMNSMVAGDDDDGESFYDKISPQDKERNLIIAIGGSKFVKLPMPYGYNVFWNIGRTAAEIMRRGGDRWKESSGHLLSSIVDAFNPVGGTNSLLNFFSPTIFDPIVDLSRNRNFMDRPIMPEQNPFDTPTPDNQRYFGEGPTIWRPVTDFLNVATGGDSVVPGSIDVSPETMEYLSGVAMGAAGSFVMRLVDIPGKAMSDEGLGFNDIPFARKVMGDKPSWYDKSAYYDRTEQIQQAESYAKDYMQGGQMDKAQDFVAHNAKVLSMLPTSKLAQRQMSELRKAKSSNVQALESGAIDRATYRDNRSKINAAEKDVVTRFNTAWNAAINGTDSAGE